MVSGIPLILGLGTRMSDPSVYVVFWAPIKGKYKALLKGLGLVEGRFRAEYENYG